METGATKYFFWKTCAIFSTRESLTMFSAFARGASRRAMVSPRSRRPNRLSVLTLEARDVPATGLGVANDYSAFILHDASLFNSDVEGRVAVGGNATLTAYGLGNHLANSNGTRDDLVVGGNLDFTNGQVFFGNVVYGGTGHFDMFGHPGGTIRQQAGVINFGQAETDLKALSDNYAGMAATGSLVNQYGTIILNGHAGQNVFNVPATTLWNANDLRINAPAGATVIVNVTGHRGPDAVHGLPPERRDRQGRGDPELPPGHQGDLPGDRGVRQRAGPAGVRGLLERANQRDPGGLVVDRVRTGEPAAAAAVRLPAAPAPAPAAGL